jgi:hypothetical protein
MTSVIVGTAVLTSCAAVLFGRRVLGRPAARVRQAVVAALETVGIAIVFLAMNAAVAAALVLAMRAVRDRGMPLYAAIEPVWLGISLLQALVFQFWRRGG